MQIEITETKENITESEKEEVSEVVQTMDEEILLQEDLVDDSAELMALEKEIQELEEKEQKEKILQKQKEDILDFSSEDIWDLGGAKGSEKSDDTIRFAEDIESLNNFKSDDKNSEYSGYFWFNKKIKSRHAQMRGHGSQQIHIDLEKNRVLTYHSITGDYDNKSIWNLLK